MPTKARPKFDPNNLDLDRWVSIVRASEMTGFTTQHFYYLIKNKRLDPAAVFSKHLRRWMIHKTALRDIERRGRGRALRD